MCTSLFLLDDRSDLLLLLLFNRDEFFQRATAEAHFWHDHQELLAGRDLVSSGTWLGITLTGRFALLTNFREVAFNKIVNAPSRGALTADFLTGTQAPLAYLQGLPLEHHNGVNMVVGDLRTGRAAYATNRGPPGTVRGPRELPRGLHALSNATLNEGWPKVTKARQRFEALVEGGGLAGGPDGALPWDALLHGVMGDAELAAPAELPDTGLAPEMEHKMSAAFVAPWDHPGGQYGTRSQTALAVWRDGRAELHERYRSADGAWRSVHHAFRIQLPGVSGAGAAAT
ncbi:hypothetical protein WJX81_006841 [Elliptochloris bilobata]|uniref:NRDE family protein n=1 Tax=Elliptochloris bilobata TaxID=381761 RepID=A0AAW1SIV9_9CHLO